MLSSIPLLMDQFKSSIHPWLNLMAHTHLEMCQFLQHFQIWGMTGCSGCLVIGSFFLTDRSAFAA